MAERVSVIVNPSAGRGRGARMVPRIKSLFNDHGVTDILTTAARGDETALVRSALERGSTTIVVVGGDGTTSHAANAILKSGASARLAVIPAGTGNDFAKVLGTDKCDPSVVVGKSVQPGEARVDVGIVEDRYFLNCCGFGFDVAVLEASERNKWLTGNALYFVTALRELFGFPGVDLAVAPDKSARHMLVVFANTEYFGGIFRIAPGARVDDGELDMIDVLNIPPWSRIPILTAATRGNHLEFAECVMKRARSFDVAFPSPPAYETDGELHQAASAQLTVSACPGALRVVTAFD